MDIHKLTDELSASPQIAPGDLSEAKRRGFRSILVNRPDGEATDQPSFAEMGFAASEHGLEARYVPVKAGATTAEDVAAFRMAMAELPKPVLGYCRSGVRTASLWALGQAGSRSTGDILSCSKQAGYDLSDLAPRLVAAPETSQEGEQIDHEVVIVGAGAGGIAVAASMLARASGLDVAIVEPADEHFYQPGWTLVGAGVFTAEETRREMSALIPDGVTRIKAAVTGFDPDKKTLSLDDGRRLVYRKLIVVPGLKLDWAAVQGLEETLGKNGVTSNYRYDLAPYTWELVKSFSGGIALFTQPPMPIKCAGAPQKAMYLSCDQWRRRGVLPKAKVEFLNAGPTLFGVADYVPPLMEYVKAYGIDLSFKQNLVRVDGPAKTAFFKKVQEDGEGEIVERRFDMMHVTPPQCAPDFVKNSPLAGADGWVEVDPASLRHVRYPDIYSLGDAMSAPNAKTAAAARKQAPVVAENVLRDLGKLSGDPAIYDGYGSCPLTVERGKVVLAEFAYGGKRVPSFPKWFIDDLKPSRTAWLLKTRILPQVYWNAMLKGRETLAKPKHEKAA